MAKKRGARRRWRQFLFSTRSQQKIVCQEHVQSSLSHARQRNFTIIGSDNGSINMFIFLSDYKNRPGTLYLEIGDGTRKKSRSHLVCGDTFRSTKVTPQCLESKHGNDFFKKMGWRVTSLFIYPTKLNTVVVSVAFFLSSFLSLVFRKRGMRKTFFSGSIELNLSTWDTKNTRRRQQRG